MKLATKRTKTENLFKILANKAPVGIYVVQDGKFCYINPTFRSTTGYREDELLGRDSLELIIPEDREMVRENVIKMLKGEVTSPCQFRVAHKDGGIRWVVESVVSIQYRGRQATLGYFVDITEHKQMEEVLRQSEENYRALFSSSVIGTFVLDAETMKVLMANQVAAKIFGFSSVQEIVGVNPLDFLPSDDRERAFKIIMKDMFERDLRRTHEWRAMTKDGREIWIITVGARVLHQGRLAGLISFVDVTERKQMEEALNIQRAYFQQLFDNSPDAMVMATTDARVIQTNRGFETLFGYSPEETKGQHIKELIIPENRVHELVEKIQVVLKGKALRKETVRRDKNGNLVDVSVLSYPISFDGKIVGLYFIYTDITERKRMEEALKLAAAKWKETFDSISDAVIITDTDFRIQRVNKAFADLFHLEISQVVDKHCYELLHCEDTPISGCPHRQTLTTKKPTATEFYASHLEKHLLEATSPIFDKQGEVVGTVHIIRDITAQKLQAERLIMADRLVSLGELVAGTAHELNNPLTSIIGFSQLLMEKEVPDDIHENLELIHSEAQRVTSITNNLLTFARNYTPLKRRSQIKNIIEDVLKLRAYEHKVNNIKVKKQLDPDIPEVMVDYFQMQQVFLNIIINAEYFMTAAHNRGTLTIITQKGNDTVKISFADDGPGIPPENLRRIFDPFFTTKPAGRGTGLGLSICHGIVTEHGGQLYARSQLGKGATIVVELPVDMVTDNKWGMPKNGLTATRKVF
jgi:PAS domain S-box-containing protein